MYHQLNIKKFYVIRMYHQFYIQQFYVLPTPYLCVLCGSENKQRLSPYTALSGWFYKRDTECLLRGTS